MVKMLGKSLTVLSLCALTTSVYCAPQWYFTFGAGLEVPNIRSHATVNNNSLASPPYDQDLYSSENNNNAALLLEAGKRWSIPETGLKSIAIGVQYQYFLPTDVGRKIMQYSTPEFLNYRYRLDLEANILLLNAKIELFSWEVFTPFINVGAGAVQLMAKRYKEYAYPGVTERTSPDFQNQINYGFAYQAGAGINWALTETLTASINYIYHPLARFSTNNGHGSWANRKLDFDNASAQSAFVTVTYMA